MGISDYLLFCLARNWPSPLARLTNELGQEVGTDAYEMAYAQYEFNWKVRYGLLRDVNGLDVLEIGCGHGGITCFIAVAGARRTVGIDLDTKSLGYAHRFAKLVANRFGPDVVLPVEFLEMNASRLTLDDASFDLVVADNAFEHFTDPETVMREAFRVLRPGGGLLVPVFSSIWSKNGLHLKRGLKLPWANVFFSEATIIRAMHRLAKADASMYDRYPGLANNPQRVRDLRRHGDLNDINYREFKAMAGRCGFRIESFTPFATRFGKIVAHLPGLKNSRLMDVFSTGAGAYLTKPNPQTNGRVNTAARAA